MRSPSLQRACAQGTSPRMQKRDIQPGIALAGCGARRASVLPRQWGDGARWRGGRGACTVLMRHRCCWRREAWRRLLSGLGCRCACECSWGFPTWGCERGGIAERIRYHFSSIQVRRWVALCGQAGSGEQLHLGMRRWVTARRGDDRAHSSPKNRPKPTSRVVGCPRGYGSPLLVGLRPVGGSLFATRLCHKDPKTRDRGGACACVGGSPWFGHSSLWGAMCSMPVSPVASCKGALRPGLRARSCQCRGGLWREALWRRARCTGRRRLSE